MCCCCVVGLRSASGNNGELLSHLERLEMLKVNNYSGKHLRVSMLACGDVGVFVSDSGCKFLSLKRLDK